MNTCDTLKSNLVLYLPGTFNWRRTSWTTTCASIRMVPIFHLSAGHLNLHPRVNISRQEPTWLVLRNLPTGRVIHFSIRFDVRISEKQCL